MGIAQSSYAISRAMAPAKDALSSALSGRDAVEAAAEDANSLHQGKTRHVLQPENPFLTLAMIQRNPTTVPDLWQGSTRSSSPIMNYHDRKG